MPWEGDGLFEEAIKQRGARQLLFLSGVLDPQGAMSSVCNGYKLRDHLGSEAVVYKL